MKEIKENILIFIHNFFTVFFFITSYYLIFVLGRDIDMIVGIIVGLQSINMLLYAIKKCVDNILLMYYPNFDFLKELKNRKD